MLSYSVCFLSVESTKDLIFLGLQHAISTRVWKMVAQISKLSLDFVDASMVVSLSEVSKGEVRVLRCKREFFCVLAYILSSVGLFAYFIFVVILVRVCV